MLAVSSNRGTSSHTSYIVGRGDGAAWQALRVDLPNHWQIHKGQTFDICGGIEWYLMARGFEQVNRLLPDMPPGAVREMLSMGWEIRGDYGY